MTKGTTVAPLATRTAALERRRLLGCTWYAEQSGAVTSRRLASDSKAPSACAEVARKLIGAPTDSGPSSYFEITTTVTRLLADRPAKVVLGFSGWARPNVFTSTTMARV